MKKTIAYIFIIYSIIAIIALEIMKRRKKKIQATLSGSDTPNLNAKAFLNVIRFAEGTSAQDGYKYLFGSRPGNNLRLNDYSKHPNVHRPFGNTTSTAAGAYQILHGTWQEAKDALRLNDFSPASQDEAALFLIERRGGLDHVLNGDFEKAIYSVRKEWASLPGSPYGQPTKSLAVLKNHYQNNGGTYA